MGKLIIDKVTGTVLNIEGCYVIEAEQLDDSFTDSEIADLADRLGMPVSEYKITVDTMREHEAIELYYQMSRKFGWVGCIFTVADIHMQLAEEGLEGDELEKMVEKTQQTRSWRKVMEDAMNREGYEVLAEAIQEGTRLYLAIEREEQ
jgi:hypothetical protein